MVNLKLPATKISTGYASYRHKHAELRVYGKEALSEIWKTGAEEQKSQSLSPLEDKEYGEASSLREREILSQYTNTEPHNIFSLKQRHGNKLCYIRKKKALKTDQSSSQAYYAEGDALCTQERELLLVIRTADCLPFFVIMESRHKSLFGLIHAGWRGLQQQIIYAALGQMLESFLLPQHLSNKKSLKELKGVRRVGYITDPLFLWALRRIQALYGWCRSRALFLPRIAAKDLSKWIRGLFT